MFLVKASKRVTVDEPPPSTLPSLNYKIQTMTCGPAVPALEA